MTFKIPFAAKKARACSATSETRLNCSRICKNPDGSHRVRILANSATKQLSQMRINALREYGRVITALKNTDDAPLGVTIRNCPDERRQLNEIFDLQPERANRVVAMGVEARADKNK